MIFEAFSIIAIFFTVFPPIDRWYLTEPYIVAISYMSVTHHSNFINTMSKKKSTNKSQKISYKKHKLNP